MKVCPKERFLEICPKGRLQSRLFMEVCPKGRLQSRLFMEVCPKGRLPLRVPTWSDMKSYSYSVSYSNTFLEDTITHNVRGCSAGRVSLTAGVQSSLKRWDSARTGSRCMRCRPMYLRRYAVSPSYRMSVHPLTFWRRNCFLNFSTPCT